MLSLLSWTLVLPLCLKIWIVAPIFFLWFLKAFLNWFLKDYFQSLWIHFHGHQGFKIMVISWLIMVVTNSWHRWLDFTRKHVSLWMFLCALQHFFLNLSVILVFRASYEFEFMFILMLWNSESSIVELWITFLAYITHFS